MLLTLCHRVAKRQPWLATASLGLLLLLTPVWALAKPPSVLVVASKDTRIYRDVTDALKTALQGTELNLEFIFNTDELVYQSLNRLDLIITVGSQAAHALSAYPNTAKVLNTFIPKAAFEALGQSQAKAIKAGHHSAIFLEQPYQRQLQFLQLLAPNARSVGTLLGSSSEPLKSELKAAAEDLKIKLNLGLLTDQDNPVQKLEPIMSNSDAFWVIPDQSVFNRNTAKWTLMISYRQKIPLFAYSRRYVEAGALAAIYSTPESIGKETAQWLQAWAKNIQAPLPEARYPHLYETAINHATARSLKLLIPNDQRIGEALKQ